MRIMFKMGPHKTQILLPLMIHSTPADIEVEAFLIFLIIEDRKLVKAQRLGKYVRNKLSKEPCKTNASKYTEN